MHKPSHKSGYISVQTKNYSEKKYEAFLNLLEKIVNKIGLFDICTATGIYPPQKETYIPEHFLCAGLCK